jgi:CelD/BcsL family acetyltransferase involved in cellulose biosynthesis
MAGALTIFETTGEAEAIWRRAQHSTRCYVFQSFDWCHAWMETVGSRQGVTPRIAQISLDGGNVELLLPLQLQRKRAGVVTLGFLGGRQTDHAAPIIYGAAPARLDRQDLWSSLKHLLRQCDADVLDFRALRASVGDVENPLLHERHNQSSVRTYSLRLSGTWTDFAESRLNSKHRAESRRRWRKLAREGQLQFVVERNGAQAQAITRWLIERKLAQLPADKAETFAAGREFLLSITSGQSRDPSVRVSALTLDHELLAAHLGVVWQGSLIGIQTTYDPAWRTYGPGRLLMESLLQYAFEQKFQEFDFSIGDAPYKEAYCDSSEPLYWMTCPRTLLGAVYALHSKWHST